MLLALPLLVGCEGDDASFVDPYDVDRNAVCELSYTLDGTYPNSEGGYLAIQNSYITLDNTSTGLYTQSWIVSSVDCQFMVDGFDPEADLAEQADITKGIASTRALDYLYCPTIGTYTVTLNCAFVGEIAGATYSESADLWIYKESFTIEVQECPNLCAVPKIYDTDGVTEITASTLEINPGKTLYFNSESTGLDIVTESWSVKIDGEEQELTLADDGSYTFTTEGTYSDFTLAVESSNILYGEVNTNESTLPQSIKVESIPLAVTAISLDISGSVSHSSTELPEIKVTLNGVVDDIVDVTDDFTLTVTDYAGTQQTIAITSVELDSTKGALILKLDGKIYENDTVTLSYTKDEEITDKYNDENALESFDSQSVTISGGLNLLSDNAGYDFEIDGNASKNGWTKYNQGGTGVIAIVTTPVKNGTQAYQVSSGVADLTDFVTRYVDSTYSSYVTIPQGSYLIKHWIYLDESSISMDSYQYNIDYYTSSWNPHNDDSSVEIQYSYPSTKGEWVEKSQRVTYSDETSLKYGFSFKDITTSNCPAGLILYLDYIQLIPIR